MENKLTVLTMTVADLVRRIAAIIRSESLKFFETVIAREATEDDLPAPAFVTVRHNDRRH